MKTALDLIPEELEAYRTAARRRHAQAVNSTRNPHAEQ